MNINVVYSDKHHIILLLIFHTNKTSSSHIISARRLAVVLTLRTCHFLPASLPSYRTKWRSPADKVEQMRSAAYTTVLRHHDGKRSAIISHKSKWRRTLLLMPSATLRPCIKLSAIPVKIRSHKPATPFHSTMASLSADIPSTSVTPS